jgi:wobble nucleotide-excising tRNase
MNNRKQLLKDLEREYFNALCNGFLDEDSSLGEFIWETPEEIVNLERQLYNKATLEKSFKGL